VATGGALQGAWTAEGVARTGRGAGRAALSRAPGAGALSVCACNQAHWAETAHVRGHRLYMHAGGHIMLHFSCHLDVDAADCTPYLLAQRIEVENIASLHREYLREDFARIRSHGVDPTLMVSHPTRIALLAACWLLAYGMHLEPQLSRRRVWGVARQ